MKDIAQSWAVSAEMADRSADTFAVDELRISRRTGSLTVHLDSLLLVVWSVVGMLFLALDVCYLTMGVYGIQCPPMLDYVDGVYWVVDICANFPVGVILHGEALMSANTAATAYV